MEDSNGDVYCWSTCAFSKDVGERRLRQRLAAGSEPIMVDCQELQTPDQPTVYVITALLRYVKNGGTYPTRKYQYDGANTSLHNWNEVLNNSPRYKCI